MNLYEWMPVSTLEAIPRKKKEDALLEAMIRKLARPSPISTGTNMTRGNMARGGVISTGNIARVFEHG